MNGRLRDVDKEVREFGPGDPWPGAVWEGEESEDEEVKHRGWRAGWGTRRAEYGSRAHEISLTERMLYQLS